jgi:hypothetical protein
LNERDVEILGGRVRQSLRTLDSIGVPSLASIEGRRTTRSSRVLRGATTLATAVVIVVAGLVLGDRLNAWRHERAASDRTATAAPTPEGRYGLLVQLPGVTSPADGTAPMIALVDELGQQLTPAFDGLVQAKTSPDGRHIALWLSGSRTSELHVLDAADRSLGASLFTTTERFTRVNEAMVWASDSSAVLISTTADDTTNSSGNIRANLRAIDRASGAVRQLMTYNAFSFQPLGWDRAKGTALARAVTAQSGGKTLYLLVSDDGSAATSTREVDDTPIIANDAATFVASFPTCTPGPCRRFIIHDASTYAVVAQIDFGARGDPLTTSSASWAVLFRPRSSDVLVYFSRTGKTGVFGIELYPDAGRGPRRDLGDLTVARASDGTITSPNAYFRADGSAVFFVAPSDRGASTWTGDLIDVATAKHAPVVVSWIRATALPGPTSPTARVTPTSAEMAACAHASGYGGTLVGAFTLRAGDLARQDETRGGPNGPRPLRSNFRDYQADTPIVLCFFDGFIAAPGGPPRVPPATFRPYDRFVVAVDPAERVSLIVAGYRDRIFVAPRLP